MSIFGDKWLHPHRWFVFWECLENVRPRRDFWCEELRCVSLRPSGQYTLAEVEYSELCRNVGETMAFVMFYRGK